MAQAHIPVFLSQKPSTDNGIHRPANVFLAWLQLSCARACYRWWAAPRATGRGLVSYYDVGVCVCVCVCVAPLHARRRGRAGGARQARESALESARAHHHRARARARARAHGSSVEVLRAVDGGNLWVPVCVARSLVCVCYIEEVIRVRSTRITRITRSSTPCNIGTYMLLSGLTGDPFVVTIRFSICTRKRRYYRRDTATEVFCGVPILYYLWVSLESLQYGIYYFKIFWHT